MIAKFLTSHRARHHAGFTLVELLAIIAAIGVLIALLLPAIQQARAAARLMQCRSHLRQIGLALHNFESQQSNLPAGCDFKNYRLHSWCTQILPEIAQTGLHQQYDWEAEWYEPTSNLAVVSTSLPLFRCPSAITQRAGATDYGGNYGSSITGLTPGLLLGQAWEAGALVAINVGGDSDRRVPIRLAEITDGLSSTFLVLECADRPINSGSWGVGTNCLAIEYQINGRAPGETGETIISRHAGGGAALYCDGRVEFQSNSTDLTLLGRLSTRSGGEVAQP